MTLTSKFLKTQDIDTNTTDYKKISRIFRPKTKDTYEIVGDALYQMDLFEMPAFRGFKYVLSIINLKSRLTDVQQMKNKDANTTLNAFKKILDKIGRAHV